MDLLRQLATVTVVPAADQVGRGHRNVVGGRGFKLGPGPPPSCALQPSNPAHHPTAAARRGRASPGPAHPPGAAPEGCTPNAQAQPAEGAPEPAPVTVENPDVHVKDAFQCTPLHVAILNGAPRAPPSRPRAPIADRCRLPRAAAPPPPRRFRPPARCAPR